MTTPVPPTEPLLTKEVLALVAQERPLLDPDFADWVIDAVTTLVRQYGDSYWTVATLPSRARDIAYIVAKDYYLNPRQLRQETTGPLQESLDGSVLNGINLTEEQQRELAALASAEGTTAVAGLFTLGFTRGRVETHQQTRDPNVILWDTRGGWPIEYLTPADADAVTPEVV